MPKSSAISEASVDALLGDLRHVVENTAPIEWRPLAEAVLEHHSPAIDESLLSIKACRLQHWCRAMLEAMIAEDKDDIRSAAKMVKRYS